MLDLPAAEVHVWWAEPRLDRAWLALLDPAERDRFKAYRREEDRARFLTGTAVVRQLFATELDADPAEVRLDRSCPDCDRPHGKVRLAKKQPSDHKSDHKHASDLEVSVSHSGGWVLVAGYRGHPIGADVERVDPDLDHAELARFALTPDEIKYLEAAPDMPTAFTTTWARKEAVVKAIGEGLRTPLAGLEVAPPGEAARLVAWPLRPELLSRVHLLDLDRDAEHRAAVAVLDEKPRRVVRHTS